MGMFTKLPKELEEVDVIVAGGTFLPLFDPQLEHRD
jgi:hypothetical protein